jgi:hypothetical protein
MRYAFLNATTKAVGGADTLDGNEGVFGFVAGVRPDDEWMIFEMPKEFGAARLVASGVGPKIEIT